MEYVCFSDNRYSYLCNIIYIMYCINRLFDKAKTVFLNGKPIWLLAINQN